MVDRADDLKIGVKSTAILFGRHDLAIISFLMVLMLAALAVLGWLSEWAWPYFAALAAVALLFAWQRYIVRDRSPTACFRAFLHNNWVGCCLFLGLLGHYWLAAR
jgi:4-hydroxybenzoate polyprenyltransferase